MNNSIAIPGGNTIPGFVNPSTYRSANSGATQNFEIKNLNSNDKTHLANIGPGNNKELSEDLKKTSNELASEKKSNNSCSPQMRCAAFYAVQLVLVGLITLVPYESTDGNEQLLTLFAAPMLALAASALANITAKCIVDRNSLHDKCIVLTPRNFEKGWLPHRSGT